MTDVEKVIKGLESCPHITRDCPQDCPYERMAFCLAHLHHDALELLKEQVEHEQLKEQEAQRDYEQSVEYAQYCEEYEPTYNPEDGSM